MTELTPIYGELDPGIRELVEQLREAGFNTFASCEGGKGHVSIAPMVRLYPDRDINETEKRLTEFLLFEHLYSGFCTKQIRTHNSNYIDLGDIPPFLEVEFLVWFDIEGDGPPVRHLKRTYA